MKLLPAGTQKILLFAPTPLGSVATVIETPHDGAPAGHFGYGIAADGPSITCRYRGLIAGRESGELDGYMTFGAVMLAEAPDEVAKLPTALAAYATSDASPETLNS